MVLANFKELGGVPRYVLDVRKTTYDKHQLQAVVSKISSDNYLEIYTGVFIEDVSDQLIHMFVNEEEEYTNFKFGFASSYI
jgi:hypothetical protein